MLQFEDLAVNFFLLFLLRAYYCEKNLELVSNAFSMNVEKKKNFLRKKSHSVFEGFKGGPFEHTKTFFCKMFFFVF